MVTEAPTRTVVRVAISKPRVVANIRVNSKNPYSRMWAAQSRTRNGSRRPGSDEWCESHAISAAVAMAGSQYTSVIHKSAMSQGEMKYITQARTRAVPTSPRVIHIASRNVSSTPLRNMAPRTIPTAVANTTMYRKWLCTALPPYRLPLATS